MNPRINIIKLASACACAALLATFAFSQESTVKPPPYPGVSEHIAGVFVTPVPGIPLSAVVEIKSAQFLADGSTDTRITTENIARDSLGRIYNERRQLMNTSFKGTPPLLSFHIYDPNTRLNTFLDPSTRLARQSIFPERATGEDSEPGAPGAVKNPLVEETDLGTDTIQNVVVHGTRKSRTVPASASGTGKPVVVVNEYWYSEELHLNMAVKHDDPRTGLQTVIVTRVDRSEPKADMFQIPAGYKVVDETPER